MKDEALRIALEALESADWYINQLEITLYSADDAGTHEDRLKVQQAITAIKQALAAPVQEPYGYVWFTKHMEHRFTRMKPHPEMGAMDIKPIYTTPPAVQRQWVGLTEEEKRQIFEREDYQGWLDYINAIETKLKEKNTWVGLTRWEIDAKLKEKT
jgi:hypothetical protein